MVELNVMWTTLFLQAKNTSINVTKKDSLFHIVNPRIIKRNYIYLIILYFFRKYKNTHNPKPKIMDYIFYFLNLALNQIALIFLNCIARFFSNNKSNFLNHDRIYLESNSGFFESIAVMSSISLGLPATIL